MDNNDRQAIEGLFGKLAQVERQSSPRDAEADGFIAQAIARQPGAPYYMAQTIVVQEQALNAAEGRIAQLQAELDAARQGGAQPQGGGLFGRLFGAPAPAAPQHERAAPAPRNASGPFGGAGSVPPVQRRGAAMPAQGGGFLAGAAQTAMGVAGGVLLGNAIGSMFAGPAQAAEPTPEAPVEDEDQGYEDAAMDDGGFEDDGSWE